MCSLEEKYLKAIFSFGEEIRSASRVGPSFALNSKVIPRQFLTEEELTENNKSWLLEMNLTENEIREIIRQLKFLKGINLKRYWRYCREDYK